MDISSRNIASSFVSSQIVHQIVDFCPACADIAPKLLRPRPDSPPLLWWAMGCDKDPQCAFCRFFESIAALGERLPADSLSFSGRLSSWLSHNWRLSWRESNGDKPEPELKCGLSWSDHDKSRISAEFLNYTLSNITISSLESPLCSKHISNKIRQNWIDIGLVTDWITRCAKHHGNDCGPTDQNAIQHVQGFKVIDIKARKIVKAPQQCDYVALSYVWGVTAQTQNAHLVGSDGLLPRELPRTIEDAITMTELMGFRYLWVDKYAIDQRNPSEIHEQISKMDVIYNCATITIIAAAGTDADFGLPGVRYTPRVRQPSINIDGTMLVSDLGSPWATIGRSKWDKRAWTYQEGLFSRRRLCFSDAGVAFQCNSMQCEEIRNMSWEISESQERYFRLGTRPLTQHIGQYSHRHLSYPHDALNAMRAIFESFKRATPPLIYHYWGIPIGSNAYDYWCESEVLGPVEKSKGTETPHEACSHEDGDHKGSKPPFEFLPMFMFVIGWDTLIDPFNRRRRQFPSWSWAGWTNPDPHWASQTDFQLHEHRSRAEVWVQSLRQNGSDVPPYTMDSADSAEVISTLPKHHPDAVPAEEKPLTYSHVINAQGSEKELLAHGPILRIETEIFNVRLFPPRFDDCRHFIIVHLPISPTRLYQRDINWSVLMTENLTAQAVDYEIDPHSFDCLVLHKKVGLIVRSVGDITERVGTVELRKSFASDVGTL